MYNYTYFRFFLTRAVKGWSVFSLIKFFWVSTNNCIGNLYIFEQIWFFLCKANPTAGCHNIHVHTFNRVQRGSVRVQFGSVQGAAWLS